MHAVARTALVLAVAAALAASVAGPVAVARGRKGGDADLTKDGLPAIRSTTALVIDLESDRVLYEKDADVVRPIASISKLFGALVLLEECRLDPEDLHEMTVANRLAARGGDKTKLNTGWSYTHRDLLHAALMRSDNRALPALAESCGMAPDQFAEKMTTKARQLGLVKTTFKEPDGLSAENVSTAREVMVALKAAIKVPMLTEIMGKADYMLTAHKGERTRTVKIRNTDRLLSKNLAQILGGKTGYTDIARYCLAVAARTYEGRGVGMVFLGAEGRFTRFADFTRVIKWLGTGTAIAAHGLMEKAGELVRGGGMPGTVAGAVTRVGRPGAVVPAIDAVGVAGPVVVPAGASASPGAASAVATGAALLPAATSGSAVPPLPTTGTVSPSLAPTEDPNRAKGQPPDPKPHPLDTGSLPARQ